MSRRSTDTLLAWLGAAVLLVWLIVTPVACVAPQYTRDTLQSSGYSDVKTGGYGWFECSSSDAFATEFSAVNPVGSRVTGTVCCGILKSCTVRF